MNFSAAPAPAPVVPTALHSKMDELEGQLLAKVLALEKERVALGHSNQQQRQEVEKELDALQDRVAELEHGGSWAPQRAWWARASLVLGWSSGWQIHSENVSQRLKLDRLVGKRL